MIHAPFTVVVVAAFNVIKIVIYRCVSHNIISSTNSRETWFVVNGAMTGTYSNPQLIQSEIFFGCKKLMLYIILGTVPNLKIQWPRWICLVNMAAKTIVARIISWSKHFSDQLFSSYEQKRMKLMFYKINVSKIIVTVSLEQ